jgi:hypothetical protein
MKELRTVDEIHTDSKEEVVKTWQIFKLVILHVEE